MVKCPQIDTSFDWLGVVAMELSRFKSRFTFSLGSLLFLSAPTLWGQTPGGVADYVVSPEEVRGAWELRTESHRSVVLKAKMDELEADRNTPEFRGTPFDLTVKSRSRKVDLEIAIDVNKVAIHRFRHHPIAHSGSKEIVVEPTQRVRTTFDGEKKVTLVEEGDLAIGTIESINPQRDHIAANADSLAFAFWVNPEQLLRAIGYSPDAMTSEPGVQVDGYRCARFEIPRKGGSSRWTSAIDVDTANDCVPRQWQTWLGRKLTTRLTIDYERDAKGNLVLKSWDLTSYGDDGKVDFNRQGRVESCEVNADIDASRFTIAFPIGAQVSSKSESGIRSFVQTVDGLRPVKQESAPSQD
jgi:hypothetical protein